MKIAFGPEMPEFPSWQWIGQDLGEELQATAETTVFQREVPACDVVVFVKFKPDASALSRIRQRARVFFCPVDIYGSAAEIDDGNPHGKRLVYSWTFLGDFCGDQRDHCRPLPED